jgi:hypothetical protein
MSAPLTLAPPRLLLDVNLGDGVGNQLLLFDTGQGPALLKVYRARGARVREMLKVFSYRVLERKLGVTARQRCALERRQLALWREHGFDVPALLPLPLPEGFCADTASWLEYCPGPTLHSFVSDTAQPVETRAAALARFAGVLAKRQACVRETRLLGLVMKHASLKHVLLHAGRQIHFDLESAHAPGIDPLEALADELSGLVRSLLRAAPPAQCDALGSAFLAGHADPALLREVALRGTGGQLRRRVRRLADRARRGASSKHDALRWVLERTR